MIAHHELAFIWTKDQQLSTKDFCSNLSSSRPFTNFAASLAEPSAETAQKRLLNRQTCRTFRQ